MAYKITRHLWLQERGADIQASNVCTGRRALLSQDEFLQLLSFETPRELDDSDTVRRILDADLIVDPDQEMEKNPRVEDLILTLDKFLANQEGTTRKKIAARHSDVLERLDLARALIEKSVPAAGPLAIPEELATLRTCISVVFDHVRSFYLKDQGQDGGCDFAPGFLAQSVSRPLPCMAYEQQPCLPECSQKRVQKAAEYLKEGDRVLILGDDDLLSLYWSMFMTQRCDVFELDEQLIAFLKPRIESAEHVSLHPRDLMSGLPPEFHGQYDIVFTDPMYEHRGMDRFLLCCSQALSRENPEARVLYTTRPDLIEDGEWLEDRIGMLGMKIVKVYKDFNRYHMTGYGRRWMTQVFANYGVSAQLTQGLMGMPYLYADLFELQLTDKPTVLGSPDS